MIVDKLTRLNYDGADIHYLFSYFELDKIIIGEIPYKNSERRDNLKKLVDAENKEALDTFINKGRMGLTIFIEPLLNINI